MTRLSPQTNRKCSVDGCENRGDIRKGFCNAHYRRWRRHGDPMAGNESANKAEFISPTCDGGQCLARGCDKPIRAQGYCAAHYGRFRKYGDPFGGGQFRKAWAKQGGALCAAKECDRVAVTRGYCSAHYQRWLKTGDADGGGKMIRRLGFGGKQIDAQGYVFWRDRSHPLATKNGAVYEHRAIMAEMLERDLLSGENVHHKNGDRADNRPENLELWVTMQPAGQRPQDLVTWAREILARYENLKL